MKTFIVLDIAIRHHQRRMPTISAIVKKELYGRWRDTERARLHRKEERESIRLFVKTFPWTTRLQVSLFFLFSLILLVVTYFLRFFMQMRTIAWETHGSRNGIIIVGNVIRQALDIFFRYSILISRNTSASARKKSRRVAKGDNWM